MGFKNSMMNGSDYGKNKFSEVEKLLYDATNDKVKRFISQNKDQDILYVYAYNYNWDDGFDIPQTILDHENVI